MFARFPELEDYAAAPIEEIEAVIKTCGLFHTKARDLKAAAAMQQNKVKELLNSSKPLAKSVRMR